MQLRKTACLIGVAMMAAGSPVQADDGAAARLAAALATEEAQEGKSSPYLLPVIEQLAQLRLRDGALGEAAALRRRALDIAIAAFGCDSPSAAEAMTALATIDIDQRRILDAEPLLLIARRILSERVDGDHPAIASVYAGLARVALARGDARPARRFAERAVEIARRNPDNRSTAPLRALGAALTAEQRYGEAEPVLAEALAQERKWHGHDGADTARSLSQLGDLYLRQGRAADALPLLQQAAAIDQTRLGPAHPFIADDLYDLGLAYDALKRPEEAKKAFLSAIEVLQRGVGRDTPRLAYTELELSRIYQQHGDKDAAEAAHEDARRILRKSEAEERRREREV